MVFEIMKPIDYICGMNWVEQFDKEIHAQYVSDVSVEKMCNQHGWRCIDYSIDWSRTPQHGRVWNPRHTWMLNIAIGRMLFGLQR